MSMSGQARDVLVQEPADRKIVLDRIDMRQAGQVTHNRGDRGAPATPGRQQRPDGVSSAHLGRDIACELEDLVMQHEEPGQAELVDDRKLLLQPGCASRRCRCPAG